MALDIEFIFKFPDLAGKLRNRIGELQGIALATMQTNRGMLFDKEGAHNGRNKWAALKLRQGQILSDRGTLRKSIGPRNSGVRPGINEGTIAKFSGDWATVGTSLLKAPLLNYGGIVKAVNKKALKIPMPGGKFMFRKKVTVPPRDFISWNDQDQEELDETLANAITEILRE